MSPDYALSFGSRAGEYAATRPSYDRRVVDRVFEGRSMPVGRILDLGAGTGKLTAALIGRADEVVAVEPDDEMRAVLATSVPAALALAGSAEQIPLPDGSVDVITVGQAFHWFTRPAADYELARVLRPDGVVALIWNFPDAGTEWVAKMYESTREPDRPESSIGQNLDAALFTAAEESWFTTAHEVAGPDGLIELAHTRSWVITRPAAEQAQIDRRLRILIRQYAELQGAVVRVPQRTKVVLQRLR